MNDRPDGQTCALWAVWLVSQANQRHDESGGLVIVVQGFSKCLRFGRHRPVYILLVLLIYAVHFD